MIEIVSNVRVFYKKTSRARYISHLDITRCMQRAIKRAGIPVWYTQGFNPHIYLTFALPLALGYESHCESMDFRLVEEMSFDEVLTRLNKVLPPDIQAYKVAEQVNKPEKIVSASYDIEVFLEGVSAKSIQNAFDEFVQLDEIEVVKRTKKGDKVIDIKPDCIRLSSSISEDKMLLDIEMTAGIIKNINPTLLIDEFLAQNNLDDACTNVLRKRIFMENGEDFE